MLATMTYVIEEDEKSISGLVNINFMTRNVIDVAVASDAALRVKASRSPTTQFIKRCHHQNFAN
jgi:uncharacterized membrane protein YciS (DUF1049 family)